MDDLNIKYEEVCMRLFVESLVVEPMKSFHSLAVASIHSLEILGGWFVGAWGGVDDNSKSKTEETNLTNESQTDNVSQVSETSIFQ